MQVSKEKATAAETPKEQENKEIEQEDTTPGENFGKSPLYGNQMVRDKLQHKYGYSEMDIEEYAAKIETRPDINMPGDDDSKFVDVSNFESEIEGMKSDNSMASVNLFGVPLQDINTSDYTRDTDKANRETQKLLRDLVHMVSEFDTDDKAA